MSALRVPNLPRSTNRLQWRWIHRYFRVCEREAAKMRHDMAIFGAAYSRIDAEGMRQHVPFKDVVRYQDHDGLWFDEAEALQRCGSEHVGIPRRPS